MRGSAQALITLELGPETEVERVQKLFNEVGRERLTRLDRSLIARAQDGILVVSAAEEADPVQTLRAGRLKTSANQPFGRVPPFVLSPAGCQSTLIT